MGVARLVVAALVTASLVTEAVVAQSTDAILRQLQANGVDITALNITSTTVPRAQKGCSILTSALVKLFPSQTLTSREASFSNWTESFWSQQQEEVTPKSIFKPACPIDVSSAVLLAELFSCPFAVKSGGHAAFSGASNIQGGLSIDLSGLDNITLSSDQTVASVGAGNVWVDVYNYLEPYGLSVIGGRVSTIGVGGLTTGGGISFFSQEYGWACDNVVNYEVVLASGIIVNANVSSYPDLYWALRGGGNNFGIVTRFDLRTHVQGSLWSGSLIYLPEQSDEAIDAFYYYGVNAASDSKSAVIMNWAYTQGMFFAVADLEYANATINPPIFQNFTAIPAYQNTMEVRTLPEVTDMFQVDNPDGLRESYWTATFALTKEMIAYCVETFETEVVRAANATGYLPALVLQVISTDVTTQMQKNGGNALGLSPSDGNLLLLNLSFMWGDIADDNLILNILGAITSKTIAYAKANGLYKEYLYMNYASQYQAVIPSYGTENFNKLKSVSAKYDPYQVFQNLEPGYFKLSGQAPNTTYPS
ncbi:FAD binding domain protein [Talaromyces stipitatus ATCC 10500]|uniref:FAD binding domain protein n=1 Tax=Talaromyces stipitatus (strain ATCC 10500 / CBS 375.48 / QM 6759 / NRRL 1006) TaxID=441959 RepID=B8MT68_TALSN|nr:FAD binding domain protein [Talaromyces stipitatus ATCC 10500]EED12165.1 FAD binding domain protein [Talaromyces stipitatus ATCC 10500]